MLRSMSLLLTIVTWWWFVGVLTKIAPALTRRAIAMLFKPTTVVFVKPMVLV
jgi:hypothetical protein